MTDTQTQQQDRNDLVALTTNIVTAFVGNSQTTAEMLPDLISSIHTALSNLGQSKVVEARKEPAVSIRQSIKADYLVCLEDGKKMKMLKRHLMTSYQMTPDQYKAKWNLPADYPMVAPNYAEKRRELAKKIGLGTLRKSKVTKKAAAETPAAEAAAPAKARKPKAAKEATAAAE